MTRAPSAAAMHTLYDSGEVLPEAVMDALLAGEAVSGWERKHSSLRSEVYVGAQHVIKIERQPQERAMAPWRLRLRAWKTARRSVRVQRCMRERGIPAPAIHRVACGPETLLVVQSRAEGASVRDLLGQLDAEPRMAMIAALGPAIAAMHNRALYHGDLNINNVLAMQHDGHWHFTFIDNEQNRCLPFAVLSRALANIARMWAHARAFAITEDEQERFLQGYFSALDTRHSPEVLRARLCHRVTRVLGKRGARA